jgi:hypothetical protein
MASTYAILEDVKDALRISDDNDDVVLNGIIGSASRAIDQYCDRYFGQIGTTAAPVSRLYRANGRVVLVDDLVTLTDVEFEYAGYAETFTSLGASSVIKQPVNAVTLVPAQPYTQLLAKPSTVFPQPPGWVRVSGVWGWPEIPQQIRDACVLQSVRLFKSRDVPLGVMGGSDMLAPMRLPGGLHPDARMLCEPFRRLGLA